MRIWAVITASFLVACGTPEPREPGHDKPLSVQEHEAEAQRHEQEASKHQAKYDPEATNPQKGPMECIDQPLAGIPYSGTEPMQIMRPCWTADQNPSKYHLEQAELHLRAADRHRSEAAALMGAEKRACAGLGAEEISHSPFFHREDVLEVRPYHEHGELRGAVATFRKVPGLSAEWMRRAVACHQARAAVMGYSSTYMRYCPLMVGELSTQVSETENGIIVTMRAADGDTGAAVLGRAEDLTGGE